MINSLTNMNRVADIYQKALETNIPKSIDQTDKKSDSFTDVMIKTIDTVDQTNKNADMVISDLATGKNVDIHQAMIAIEKADISFQFMMQVRNKLISAYQEINRMQV